MTESAALRDPAGHYRTRIAFHRSEVDRLGKLSSTVSMVRVLSFLGLAACLAAAVWGKSPAASVAAAILGVIFVALVIVHERIVRREDDAKEALAYVESGLFRCARIGVPPPSQPTSPRDGEGPGGVSRSTIEAASRASADLALQAGRSTTSANGERVVKKAPAPIAIPYEHPYAGDLDVVGPRSLHDQLDTMGTPSARERLATWLLEPSFVEVVRERQQAVLELKSEPLLREELHVFARPVRARSAPLEGFLAWCISTDAPVVGTLLTVASFVLPVLTLTLFVAAPMLQLPASSWLVTAGIQYLLTFTAGGALRRALVTASAGAVSLGARAPSIRLVTSRPWTSPPLERVRATLVGGTSTPAVGGTPAPAVGGTSASGVDSATKHAGAGASADDALTSLRKISEAAEARENWIFAGFVGPMLMFDVHVLRALEAWRRKNGARAAGWVDAIAEVEALSCLGTYSFDHPSFAMPVLVEGAMQLEAEDLGHPLLSESARVTNDVRFAGPGTALLITGSNMSGKSTLMRSIGLAAVMARAGCVVCARRLIVSDVSVQSSMRISDSLSSGVSHFYAELLALKRVVAAADRGEQVLFLLDEILHGTNSHERHLGARGIVEHLLAHGAMGAVSTHDLSLIDLIDEAGKVRPVHLMELADGERMLFDYKLRDGVLHSGNALRLMKSLGLPVGELVANLTPDLTPRPPLPRKWTRRRGGAWAVLMAERSRSPRRWATPRLAARAVPVWCTKRCVCRVLAPFLLRSA